MYFITSLMTVPLKTRIICFTIQQIMKCKKPSRTLPLSIKINEILIDTISSSLQIYPLLYFPFSLVNSVLYLRLYHVLVKAMRKISQLFFILFSLWYQSLTKAKATFLVQKKKKISFLATLSR